MQDNLLQSVSTPLGLSSKREYYDSTSYYHPHAILPFVSRRVSQNIVFSGLEHVVRVIFGEESAKARHHDITSELNPKPTTRLTL